MFEISAEIFLNVHQVVLTVYQMPINYNSSVAHEATGAVGPYHTKCNAKAQLFPKLRFAGTRPKIMQIA